MKSWRIGLTYLFVFMIVFSIPLYRIYKYGWNGYLERRREKRKKSLEKIKSLFG